jgi:lipid-binding SYLF domain-containing protein
LVRTIHIPSLLAIAVVSLAAGHAADDTTKEQNEVRKMVQNTLQRLYKADPKTKAAIEGAAGYAIVRNMRVQMFVAGPGRGEGITVYNESKSETFMKRIELQARFGFGVKKFRLIFVFDNERPLHSFLNSGWDLSGPATAAAKAGHKGRAGSGEASVSDGVWMYQLTDKLRHRGHSKEDQRLQGRRPELNTGRYVSCVRPRQAKQIVDSVRSHGSLKVGEL